jgi:molybdopterin synthase catalytic subunit
MTRSLISTAPITPTHQPCGTEYGAEITFLGIVRGTEGGQSIQGIDYQAYLPMAERMLAEMVAQPAEHEVFIQHRLGPVKAGEPSVVIQVWSRHSTAAFQHCQRYLAELKQRVPIWKEIIY